MEFVWLVLLLVVLGGMWWIGYRMEPHWISKDGQRFMCGAQEFFHGQLGGHPRETQVAFLADDSLHITQKRMLRRQRSVWQLVGKAADPPKGLQIYVAQQSVDGVKTASMLALRIPTKSRCTEALDAVLVKAGLMPAPPKTASQADPPAQD